MNMNEMQNAARSQAVRKKRNSLQFMLVFGAFFLMALAGYFFVHNTLWNRLLESSERALSSAEARIQSAFVESDIILLNMYHSVQDMISMDASQDDLREYIGATTEWLRHYEGVFQLTGAYGYIRGEFMSSVFEPDDSFIPQTRPWYQAGTRSNGEAAYTAPYTDIYTGDVVISAVRSVDNKAGGIDGIIAVDVIINRLNEYLQSLKITEDGYGMIISQNMMITAHHNEKFLGCRLEELGPGYDDIAWRLRTGESISAKQIRDSDGKAVLVFFSPLSNGWYVGLVTPHATFYRDLYYVGGTLFALGFIMAFSVSVLLLRLNRARVRSDEESRSKSSFLARMSHEIRTPMNAIIGMGELALQAPTMPKMAEYVGEIKQAGRNLLAIINDILDISKIEAGSFQINCAPYELSSVLNDVITVSRVRIAEKPIVFTVFVDAAIPGRLSGDEVRIRQILLNLLSNAAKYTREGSIALKITSPNITTAEPRENHDIILALEIADSGLGIKETDLPGLFGNFVRLDLEKNRNIEGTGLGLAITRSLCQAMGGDITVTSEYGKGSVFTARIRQTVVSGEPLAWVEEPQKKGVLIFDRRSLCVDSLSRTLKNLGVPVQAASDGSVFLSELKSGNWPFAFAPSMLCAEAHAIVTNRNLKTNLALLADLGVSSADIPSITLPTYAVPVANVLNGKASGSRLEKAMVKFTAPRVHALIVDDIVTNLKVAQGLLLPYRMEVSLCTGGRKAVELVMHNEYDIVFMDHMMPDMDGIEAAAAIRAWEAEQGGARNPVILVALTANAISGMREMFLEQGFDDYLSKPIEIARLNELMGKWIPEEKQEKQGGEGKEALNGDEMPLPVIPGIDIAQGLALTGGTVEGYRQVLSLFCKDADERLALLQNPSNYFAKSTYPFQGEVVDLKEPSRNSAGLSLFITQVHALKSAAASIGATGVSMDAARLEEAGKKADTDYISQMLPTFAEHLSALRRNIRAALETMAGGGGGIAGGGSPPVGSVLLEELRDALEARDVEAVERLMEELSRLPADEHMQRMLEQISDALLMADYEVVLEALNRIPR